MEKINKDTDNRHKGRPAEIKSPVMISMRIDRGQKAAAEAAARKEGISMSKWIRNLIDKYGDHDDTAAIN